MAELAWYLKRLRVMSAREIAHRLGRQVTVLSLLAQHRRRATGSANSVANASRYAFCSAQDPQLPTLEFDATSLWQSAPALLAGELAVGGWLWRWRGESDVWHRAPDTGRRWPRRFFGAIDYREGNPIGDIRQLWEPARLQQLVDLALIARRGDEAQRRQAVDLLTAQLSSWDAENPALAGPHYISAMECALRLMAVCHTLDLVRDLPEIRADRAPWAALVTIIATHAPLIAQRLSLHSSTGNHTTAEAAGLVYAGLLFPEMTAASQWLNRGRDILQREADRQVLPDGGGVEQAFDYHRFNIQLLALVQAALAHHGRQAPAPIAAAVDRGGSFLAAMDLGQGRLAPIGDSDGGYALSRHLLFPAHATEPQPRVQTLEHSGYTVAHIASLPALTLIFDHGPLGMAPSYGHGHADALAVVLSAGGEDILLDTGTYTYTGNPRWRAFFRGTRAHNTVTVDGGDQANHEACFLWSRPYSASLIAADLDRGDEDGRLLAEHDGYRRVGVRHVRGIAWSRDRWLLVWDGLFGDGRHRLDLHWHLGAQPVWRDEGGFELVTADGTLTWHCRGGEISTLRACETPVGGWRSPTYGVIEPITTVKVRYQGPLPHAYTTLVWLPGSDRSDHSIQKALTWFRERAR